MQFALAELVPVKLGLQTDTLGAGIQPPDQTGYGSDHHPAGRAAGQEPRGVLAEWARLRRVERR